MPQRADSDAIESEVALHSPVVQEVLPLSYVHYPNHYGTFFAFSESPSEPPILCECARPAVENCCRLREMTSMETYGDPLVTAPLSSHDFPNSLASRSLNSLIDLSAILKFSSKICHRCAMTPPSLKYCVAMYGGKFKQHFGWYINQASYRLGVEPLSMDYIEDATPNELLSDIEDLRELMQQEEAERTRLLEIVRGPARQDISDSEITYWQNVKLSEAGTLTDLEGKTRRQRRKIDKTFENIARAEFGFRKVGEGWVSESLLYKIVCQLLPEYEIVRHLRPKWLERLELDIFISELNVGIEYQGQQHFQAVEVWGGTPALSSLQERDARKRVLCSENGVTLIEVDYTEPLNAEHIAERIENLVPSVRLTRARS